jgi:hypothetical protein
LFDVRSVGEDVAVATLQSVGAWSDHLHNRVQSFLWWSELVPVLGRLRPPQHLIANFEGSSPNLPLVVHAKGLVVADKANHSCLLCLLQSGQSRPTKLPRLGQGQRL